MQLKFSLFDDEDLKRFEDMIAKAMARALVSALKVAARDGLFAVPATVGPMPEVAEAPTVAEVPEVPQEPIAEPAPRAPVEAGAAAPQGSLDLGADVPRFLKPPPPNPFPPGKAVEPPPAPKGSAKTKALYAKLYKTVEDRPQGFISVVDATNFLGENSSGILSTWLQKGQVEAVIVAGIKPPTKGLPGRLMISKDSLRERDKLRQQNRKTPPGRRSAGSRIAA